MALSPSNPPVSPNITGTMATSIIIRNIINTGKKTAKTCSAKALAFSEDSSVMSLPSILENMGTKATEKAPSANKRRKKLGNLKAIKKASAALVAYAAGLPAYVLTKVLAPGFYARGDTKTPVKYGIIVLIVNTSLNFALIGPLGHVGLALGTAIAAWVNVALLYGGLQSRGQFELLAGVRLKLAKFLAASGVMAYGLMMALGYLRPYFYQDNLMRVGALVTLIGGGIIVYFVTLMLLRGFSRSDLRAFFSSKA